MTAIPAPVAAEYDLEDGPTDRELERIEQENGPFTRERCAKCGIGYARSLELHDSPYCLACDYDYQTWLPANDWAPPNDWYSTLNEGWADWNWNALG